MSQRGGSISSDVRFGKKVVSPMIPEKKIDFLLSLAPEWSDAHMPSLAPDAPGMGKQLAPMYSSTCVPVTCQNGTPRSPKPRYVQ